MQSPAGPHEDRIGDIGPAGRAIDDPQRADLRYRPVTHTWSRGIEVLQVCECTRSDPSQASSSA